MFSLGIMCWDLSSSYYLTRTIGFFHHWLRKFLKTGWENKETVKGSVFLLFEHILGRIPKCFGLWRTWNFRVEPPCLLKAQQKQLGFYLLRNKEAEAVLMEGEPWDPHGRAVQGDSAQLAGRLWECGRVMGGGVHQESDTFLLSFHTTPIIEVRISFLFNLW